MNLSALNGVIRKGIKENSSLIFSIFAGVGTLTTAYLAHQAGAKKALIIEDDRERRQDENGYVPYLGRKHNFNLLWRNYVPTAISATSTIICIVGANRVGVKKTLAAQTALAVSQQLFSDYRDKVVEEFGANKDRSIRDKIAEERVKNNPPSKQDVLISGPGNVLCCELYTGRYFTSNMEVLRRAQNDLNSKLIKNDYATLNDFYYMIDLRQTSYSGETGWKSDRLMELTFSAVLVEEDKPCIAFEYNYVTSL